MLFLTTYHYCWKLNKMEDTTNQGVNWQRPHHAYFLLGNKEEKEFFVDYVTKGLDFAVEGNPDFSIIETAVFGIEEARKLYDWVILKPFAGEKKVKVVFTNSITSESQNALLKVLEEPNVGSYIFFVIPSIGSIYKTLLSRVVVVENLQKGKVLEISEAATVAKEFCGKGVAERIALVQRLHKNDDKGIMKDLVREIENIFYKKMKDNKKFIEEAANLKLLDTSVKFVSTRGASSKMILEHLACIFPVL